MAYATGTDVPVDRSKSHIEMLLMRWGASQFGYMTSRTAATICFRYKGYGIKFDLPLPDPGSPEFTLTPSGRRQRSEQDAAVAWEKACRSRWRILLLTLRAKLEAVEAGISTFEAEFLPWIVCEDGSTIGQNLLPNLDRVIAIGPMRLLGLPEPK